MDKAYCISLGKVVTIDEAIELFRNGEISRQDDFACNDPECRADYICINLGKTTYKVFPYFRTADNPARKHVEGCKNAVKEKLPQVVVGPPRRPRHPIEDAEIVFENSRPPGYFDVPIPWSDDGVSREGTTRYVSSGESTSESRAANSKCYSVERVLNGGWGSSQRLSLDGHSGTIKSVFKPIDSYAPDSYRRFIYCGLAKISGSEDGFFTFKFGRSFAVGVNVLDVYIRLEQSALTSLMSSKSLYYKDLIQKIVDAARKMERYPKNPFFCYALGLPRIDAIPGIYCIDVNNLDHFYIESVCSRPSLIGSEYSDWERNEHYFIDDSSEA
ncbi:MAG TPA: hypothetical protein EYH47_21985 [Pseudomonas oleovorans]|nr:hypothetical protein [Pseudomonas oleovorans]